MEDLQYSSSGSAEPGSGNDLRLSRQLPPSPSSSVPSSLAAECTRPHATLLIVLAVMILLDGIDKHDPPQPGKLVAESSSAPVARSQTPTPSLPDYEASQAQLKPTTQSFPEIQKQRTRRRRWKKCALYTLVVYFVVTVAIGVPLIVLVRIFLQSWRCDLE